MIQVERNEEKKCLNYIFGIIARKQLKSIGMKSLAFLQIQKEPFITRAHIEIVD